MGGEHPVSDGIQRYRPDAQAWLAANLGLPREPTTDRQLPFNQVPRDSPGNSPGARADDQSFGGDKTRERCPA